MVANSKYLTVYEHIDALDSNGVYVTVLAIGYYGTDADDICYFPLNKAHEACALCAELNRARGHVTSGVL